MNTIPTPQSQLKKPENEYLDDGMNHIMAGNLLHDSKRYSIESHDTGNVHDTLFLDQNDLKNRT